MKYLRYLPIFTYLLVGIAQGNSIFGKDGNGAEESVSSEELLLHHRMKRQVGNRPRFGFLGDGPTAHQKLNRVKRANHPIFQNSHVIDRDTYKHIVDDPSKSTQRAEDVLNRLNAEDKALRKAEWERNNPGKSGDNAPVVGRGKNRRMQWENANPLNQRKVQSLIATNNPQDAHFSFNKDPNRQIVDRPGIKDNVFESSRPFRILEVNRDSGKNGPVTRVEKATAPVAVALDKNKLPVHYQGVFSPADGLDKNKLPVHYQGVFSPADGVIAPPNSPTRESSISRRASSPMIRDLGTTIKELRVSSNREPIVTTPRATVSGGGRLRGSQSQGGATGGGGGNIVSGSPSSIGGGGSGGITKTRGSTNSQIGRRADSPVNVPAEQKRATNSMGSNRQTPAGAEQHGSISRTGAGGNTISSSRSGSLTANAWDSQAPGRTGNRMGGSTTGNSGGAGSISAVKTDTTGNTMTGSRGGSIRRGSGSNMRTMTDSGGSATGGSQRGSISTGTTGSSMSGGGRGSTNVQPSRNSAGGGGIGTGSTSIIARGGSSVGQSNRSSVGGGMGSTSGNSGAGGGRGGGLSRSGSGRRLLG